MNVENKHLYNNIYGSFTILKNILLCTGVLIARNFAVPDESPHIDVNLELETPFLPIKKFANLQTT